MTPVKLWIRDLLSLFVWMTQRFLGRPRAQGIRILVYHAIADLAPRDDHWRMSVPPALLAAQMRWLRQQGYSIVSLGEALEMVQGKRPMAENAVAVTFDDGFHDTLTRAYPILEREQVPATVFVVPQFLEASKPFPWLERPTPFERPLSWDELRRLASQPMVSVGSHTWSHRRLSGLSPEDQQQDIAQSKTVLEARLGRPIPWFAYPYGNAGSFSEETIACLQRLGFEAACGNLMGVNRVGDSLWTLKRTRIGWEDRLWRFRLKMLGFYDWLDARS